MSNLNWRPYVGGAYGTACRPVCVCAEWANPHSLVSHPTGQSVMRTVDAVANHTLLLQCKLWKILLCALVAATGDIDDMWLRDSSVQLAIYLPRIAAHPALRGVFEGMLRSQAFYILQVQCGITLLQPLSLCTQPSLTLQD